MSIEYILLLMLSFFPLLYKLLFWGEIFEGCEYNVSRFKCYMSSVEGKQVLLHFWGFLELPIFLLSGAILINPPLEVFLYNIFFYFLLLYNIFVFGRIGRGMGRRLRIDIHIFLTSIWIILAGIGMILINEKLVYLFISGGLIFMPLYFLCTISVGQIFVKTKYIGKK